jgi:RsiW-degrading membrane proteinase PrsW (M82 family)
VAFTRLVGATRISIAAKFQQLIASRGSAVTRTNTLYLVIGALALAVAVLGYQLYQDRQEPKGVHIDLGPGGLSIQGK